MADVVLVVLRRPELATTLLHAAQRVATLMGGARLNVLAVQEQSRVSALGAEALIAEARSMEQMKQQERLRVATLQGAFAAWVRETGSDAYWTEAEGSAPAIIGERGSRADLVVVGQPPEDDRLARQAFSAALFGTDRPVLMVPPGSSTDFGRRIAIAWRDEKRAVSAVIPALRWLSGAEHVHVLCGVREGAPAPVMPRVLREHGIAADLHTLRIGAAPFGQTLLEAAHDVSADLLVMGAYAHSPLRELVFGGVTRRMIDRADLPVLMRH
ncbi:MAG TPA: universal stress protein [Acetobacteraceae bacterium]|nr:universal stress protein [Acetobacteraceae bacterium]